MDELSSLVPDSTMLYVVWSKDRAFEHLKVCTQINMDVPVTVVDVLYMSTLFPRPFCK